MNDSETDSSSDKVGSVQRKSSVSHFLNTCITFQGRLFIYFNVFSLGQ